MLNTKVNLFDLNGNAKPFLKWAGGKSQLLPEIKNSLPNELKHYNELTYIEPFVGSGAVLFWFLRTFPNVKRAIIFDINSDLTQAYQTIKEKPYELIESLELIQKKYFSLTTEETRREYYLKQREIFNTRELDPVKNTCLLIFLNRTCFNGLYRVNSKNKFNVPFGKYINPKICDKETILADSEVLQKVSIINGDFEDALEYASDKTFFYFDPPYKPISSTASFTSYAKDCFDDEDQLRLKNFCERIDMEGHSWLMSNSDLKNIDPNNNFFDDLYSDYKIQRVKAKRNINSVGTKRGEIFELLICNYEKDFALSSY
jgi:DNA adenine methylase